MFYLQIHDVLQLFVFPASRTHFLELVAEAGIHVEFAGTQHDPVDKSKDGKADVVVPTDAGVEFWSQKNEVIALEEEI
jgi:hypothetical protein